MSRLKGQNILVTGGNGAIGQAIVKKCVEEGAKVAIIDKKGEKKTDYVMTFIGDISNEFFIKESLDIIENDWGVVHGLINNAGIMVESSLEEETEENWEKHLNVNVKGMMLTAKHAMPLMKKAGSGSIVNCSSIMAFTSSPNSVSYTTSKAAILGLTRAIAMEGATSQIRANVICPGTIDTPMYREYLENKPNPLEHHKKFQNMYPLGRIGTPEDVANMCVFLLSSEASWITGESFIVDGGYMIKGTND